MRFVGPDPLQNVVNPVDPQDAATKGYVDARVAQVAAGGLTRQVVTLTATGATPGTVRTLNAALGASYILLAIRTSAAARVRLYATAAAAAADTARAVTTDPGATVALILEYVTADSTAVPVCPAVTGAPFAQTGTSVLVTNLSGSTVDLGVEITYLALES